MKRWLCVLGAVTLISASVLSDEAMAQRRGVGAVGVRGVAVRGVGVGVRGVAIRGGVWRPGLGVARWGGWGLGWGWSIAAAGYAGYPYYNACLAWNGWRWVNFCY